MGIAIVAMRSRALPLETVFQPVKRLGAVQAVKKLPDRAAAQRIAPVGRNGRCWTKHESAFAHCYMRYGEGWGVGYPNPA